MIFNSVKQLGLNFTQQIKDEFYRLHKEKYLNNLPNQIAIDFDNQWKEILSDSGNKNLYLTKSAREVIDKIKIDKFQPEILQYKKDKKLTFLIDDKCFYRITIRDNYILIMYVTKTMYENGTAWLNYDTFKIHPTINTVVFPKSDNYMEDKMFIDIVKMIIFIEYSSPIETILKPKEKIGTKKSGKYLNDSNQNFTVVDSSWNKMIIRNEEFGVSGHFRLQRCGSEKKNVKLIYIREYIKKGYIRKPKTDNNNPETNNNNEQK